MQEEVWKDIPEYEGCYQVSNQGNVRSLDRLSKNGSGEFILKGKTLKARMSKNSYKTVALSKDNKKKSFTVHQLVAIAFLNHKPNGYKDLIVDHIDNNPLNNNVTNLQLVTVRHNVSKDKNGQSLVGTQLSKTGNRWNSRIKVKGKLTHLGSFLTEEEAHECYKEAVRCIEEGFEIKHKKKVQASIYRGVQWIEQRCRWVSNIYSNGKSKRIGSFKCELAAASAYQKELIKLNKIK